MKKICSPLVEFLPKNHKLPPGRRRQRSTDDATSRRFCSRFGRCCSWPWPSIMAIIIVLRRVAVPVCLLSLLPCPRLSSPSPSPTSTLFDGPTIPPLTRRCSAFVVVFFAVRAAISSRFRCQKAIRLMAMVDANLSP